MNGVCSLWVLSDCQGSPRTEEDGGQGKEEDEGDEATTDNDANAAQLALLEVWMGLPGYAQTRGQNPGGESATALLKLRKALRVDGDPTVPSSGEGTAEEGAEAIASASPLNVRHPKYRR